VLSRDRLKADLDVDVKTVMTENNRGLFRYRLGEQMFAGVDYCFIQFQILCQLVEERLSWSVGQHIRMFATPVHEAFLTACRWVGWSLINPNAITFAQAELPGELPRSPSLGLNSKTVSRRAEELLQGLCRLDDNRSVKVEELSWSQDPFGEISNVAWFNFHCLDWVRELVDAYCLSWNRGYLDQAKNLTLRWISQCLCLERHSLVWDDHTTALRLIVICQLWVVCRSAREENPEFIRELISAVLRHGRRLELKRFYRASHNHGITQAYALIVAGLLFRWLPEGSNWVELGRLRLEQQMRDNVSSEGMHREHSPYYHFYVFNQFLYAYQFGAAYGIEYSKQFADRLKKMMLCGSYVIKPNGVLPAMGDTCESSPILLSPEDVTEWFSDAGQMFLYSLTAGRKGFQPDTNSVVLSDAGIAFLRSGWGTERPFRDELFAAVRTSTFGTSHIHLDQCSFEFYAYGEDLIVDSGGPYGYAEPMRKFFLSTAAHNTVVVDGANQGIGKAQILHSCNSSGFDLLAIEQRSYPNVVHRRTILFVRPYYLVILDAVDADKPHQFSQLFHLSPNLLGHLDGHAIRTDNLANGPTIQILPLLEDGLTVKLHKPGMSTAQGWVCVAEKQKIGNTVVEYRRSGASVEFVALLVPQPAGASNALRARMESVSCDDARRIHVFIGDRRDEILFSSKGTVRIESMKQD
jgi:hypothetical protein